MFIFPRPFSAVAAALAVALLVVVGGQIMFRRSATYGRRGLTGLPGRGLCRAACLRYRRRRIVTFPFPAACRPPVCELASESEKPNRSRPGGSGCVSPKFSACISC